MSENPFPGSFDLAAAAPSAEAASVVLNQGVPKEAPEGTFDDGPFLVKTITEIGATIQQDVLAQVSIDDHRLDKEALELPNLIFYWQAAFGRLDQRVELKKLEVKRTECQLFIGFKDESENTKKRMTMDEIKARVEIEPAVYELKTELAELLAKRETARAVMSALRQKGYSLQLIATMRGKEEDWLRQSLSRRLQDHPQRESLMSKLNEILGGIQS